MLSTRDSIYIQRHKYVENERIEDDVPYRELQMGVLLAILILGNLPDWGSFPYSFK